jgi:ketosteroid isomerase-like protein
MSQKNVEIVRRVIDVMDAEGFEAALPIFLEAAHPDVEWREDPAWPGSANYRGAEQVRQVIRDRMDTLDFDQQTEDLIDVGEDKVVALVRWVGRGKQAVRRAKCRWRWSGRSGTRESRGSSFSSTAPGPSRPPGRGSR